MGVDRHGGTPIGCVTPICDDCGVSLCWDLSDEEYSEAKGFWDEWTCRDCNDGESLSLKSWQARRSMQSAE